MINIINKLFMFLKILLLIVAFGLTLYIILYMYYSLGKQPFGNDLLDFVQNLIPFVLLLILYMLNIALKQKTVNDNIFYNITCFLVTVTILFIGYRAMCDQNMILWHKTDYHINFDYYADQLFQIKAMLYGLVIANGFLIGEHLLSKKKKVIEFND